MSRCGFLPTAIKLKRGGTVMFTWTIFKSRADCDRVNGKVLKDPRPAKMMGQEAMLFDASRMVHGGFKIMVEVWGPQNQSANDLIRSPRRR